MALRDLLLCFDLIVSNVPDDPGVVCSVRFQNCTSLFQGKLRVLVVESESKAVHDVHVGEILLANDFDGLSELLLSIIGAHFSKHTVRREPNAHFLPGEMAQDLVNDFHEEPGTICDRSAILVVALVAATLKELIDQVAVGSVDFYKIKSSTHCVLGRRSICLHNGRNFIYGQLVGNLTWFLDAWGGMDLAFDGNWGRGDHGNASGQVRMSLSPHVP
mmetsp:Transcript_13475/g.27543  ORF Transcript_13475/g.27543 Transcript_13475/m.27543 type:complete len:217 (-) Transcript_13475:427-1077(-)